MQLVAASIAMTVFHCYQLLGCDIEYLRDVAY